ncbi:CHAT domain protein [compost metagenome]
MNDQKSDSTEVVHDVTCMGITFNDHNPYEYLNLGPLDNSVKEATTIAEIFNGNLITEKEVTEESFIAAMQSSKWLHLSTHGMLDVNAPAFHRLFLHEGVGTDGILNAYELIDYRFDNIDLLTLSACETALGRFDYSDNIRGLPATLMQCGVKTIIGTLWECEIESSELFFYTLYSKLKEGESKLSAFTSAQKKVREEHPDYRDWGCFYYSGKFD